MHLVACKTVDNQRTCLKLRQNYAKRPITILTKNDIIWQLHSEVNNFLSSSEPTSKHPVFAAMDRLENRAVIKFCRDPGETPTEAYKMITVARSKTSISRTWVSLWYRRFQECGDSIQERPGRGRKSSVTEKTLTSICDALDEGR